MDAFTNGRLAAPLDRANVDADQIIPKQYLKSIKRTGLATICSTRVPIRAHWHDAE